MSTLHSHAPAHPLETTKRIIEKAFNGRRFEDIFEEFQEEPLGVGAIAQAYKARLKPELTAPIDEYLELEPQNLRQRIKRNVEIGRAHV